MLLQNEVRAESNLYDTYGIGLVADKHNHRCQAQIWACPDKYCEFRVLEILYKWKSLIRLELATYVC